MSTTQNNADMPEPCPCCKSTARFHEIDDAGDNHGGMYIECGNKLCGITTRLQFGENRKNLLLEAWNTRLPSPVAEGDNYRRKLNDAWQRIKMMAIESVTPEKEDQLCDDIEFIQSILKSTAAPLPGDDLDLSKIRIDFFYQAFGGKGGEPVTHKMNADEVIGWNSCVTYLARKEMLKAAPVKTLREGENR